MSEDFPSVRVKWDKERPVKLVAAGEEASEIKWIDTGVFQIIPNNQLDFFTNKRINRKKEK